MNKLIGKVTNPSHVSVIGQSCRWYFHKFAQITKSLTEQTSQLISLFWTMYSSFTILGKLFLALSFLIFPSQLVDSRTLMTIKSHANHAWQNTEHYHIKLSFIWMVTRYGFIKTLKWSKSTWWKLLTNGFRANVHTLGFNWLWKYVRGIALQLKLRTFQVITWFEFTCMEISKHFERFGSHMARNVNLQPGGSRWALSITDC